MRKNLSVDGRILTHRILHHVLWLGWTRFDFVPALRVPQFSLTFFIQCLRNHGDVLMNGMVFKRIDFSIEKSSPKANPPITSFSGKPGLPNLAAPIEVDLISTMPIAKPPRWHPRDDIVVVDIPQMIQLGVLRVSRIPHSRTAKGKESLRVAIDMGKQAASSAKRPKCHWRANWCPEGSLQ